MYLCLNGFEAQVFLNFGEVEDTASRAYTKLFSRLSGAGVPDMNAAMQDIEHEDLYGAWNALFGKVFFTGISAKEPAAKEPRPTVPDIEKAMLSLLDQCGLALPSAEKESAKRIAGEARRLDGIMSLMPGLVTSFSGQQELPTGPAITATLMAAIRCSIALELIRASIPLSDAIKPESADSPPPALAGAFARAGAPAAAGILLDFGLDRKLVEAMAEAGIDGETARRALNFALAASPFLSLSGETADSLIQAILRSQDARILLGVNTWQGQTWFNKEGFEFALAFAACFPVFRPAFASAAASGNPDGILQASIKNWCLPLREKAETSGWKLDVFLESCGYRPDPLTTGDE